MEEKNSAGGSSFMENLPLQDSFHILNILLSTYYVLGTMPGTTFSSSMLPFQQCLTILQQFPSVSSTVLTFSYKFIC